MSSKIKLADGQQEATYRFEGDSFADLGAKLDAFYASVDYATLEASSLVSAYFDIRHIRSMMHAEPLRTAVGGYRATVNVYRRGR